MSGGESGIWLVDKPAGMSSAQVVGRLKRKHGCARIGHAGKLDPMATGLLVCLVNSATRLASYAESGTKTYAGTVDLGAATFSDDAQGRVLSSCAEIPEFEKVRQSALSFTGVLQQIPPRVSAIKVGGVRAYRAARAGRDVDLEPRRVEVYQFDLEPVSRQRFFFRVRCSKGTYIRALARDLGEKLGCGAYLSSLRREASAPFSISQAAALESLGWESLLPWTGLFPKVPRLSLDGGDLERLKAGDQRNLADLIRNGAGECEGASNLIYIDRNSGEPRGLLAKQQDLWRLAANLD